MSAINIPISKRRPVDILFGQNDQSIPGKGQVSSETAGDLSTSSANSERSGRSDDYRNLAFAVDTLYRQISEPGSASPKLESYCLSLLARSRQTLESDAYALAGYNTQQAKARLLRARLMEKAAHSSTLNLLLVWEVVVGLIAVATFLNPQYVLLNPVFLPLVYALSLGALGGTVVPFRSLYLSRKRPVFETLPSSQAIFSPFKGALVGAFVFLLSELGIVASPGALGLSIAFGRFDGAHLLMLVFAFLGGVTNKQIFAIVQRVWWTVSRAVTRAIGGPNNRTPIVILTERR